MIKRHSLKCFDKVLTDVLLERVDKIFARCFVVDCLDSVDSDLSWYVVQCDCDEGYTGQFCDEDVDGCAESPCFGACTDVVASQV